MSAVTTDRAGVRTQAAPRKKLHLDPGQIAAHAVLIVLVIVDLMPFIWMVLGSFKTYDDLARNPWLPRPWTLSNYREILRRGGMIQGFINSVLVVIPRVTLVLFTSAAVGFVFAKYRFPGRNLLFTLLLSTMMVPFVVVLIPLYVTLSSFGLIDRLGALIVVAIYSTVGTFIMRQAITDIPDDLLDAARIDGANEIWIYARLIVPLVKAPLAALAIFSFLGSWDDYIFPSIILKNPAVRTLPIVLAGLRPLYWDRYELYAAGSMVTVVPVMIVYTIMQRQFVRGIALTGFK